jgi:protein disulfide-isomerase A6
MKQAWEDLGTEYESSSSVLIGDADCTVEQGLCSKQGVSGYPTIKYYMQGEKEGKSYSGGRSLEALKTFTADTLEVKCSVKDTSGCSEKETKFMENFKAKDGAAVSKELARLQGMKAGSMKPDLKQWLVQRINILKQLEAEA